MIHVLIIERIVLWVSPCIYIIIKKKNKKTKRQKEHLVCCRKGQVEKSSLAKHAFAKDHRILWKNCTLVSPETCNNPTRRKVSEICFTLFHH